MFRDPHASVDLVEPPDPTAPPRVVGREQALRLGFSRRAIEHRLATGRWRRVLPRTYLTVDTLTWPDRANAALSFVGPLGLLSGAAALADRGLRCVRPPERLLVVVPPQVTVRSTRFVRVRRTHRMPAHELCPGPRRVPAGRAVADLALETIRLDDVRTLVAQAVRAGLCTIEEIRSELDAGPRRGSAHLRIALDDVTAGAWSAPEAAAARLLRTAVVPPFVQNASIELPGGGRYVADFLWRKLRAVLEIDSVTHHLDPRDWRATMDRHLALETLGYSVVHRTPRDVADDPAGFVAGVERWLRARARDLHR